MRRIATFCVAVLLLQLCSALTTKIDALSQECFVEKVERDVPMSFQFKVTAGGKKDLDVSVYDQSGRTLQQWKAATEGHYSVRGDAVNTLFKYCFSNEMARFTPKWVNFYFHHGPHPSAAKPEQLDPIERQIEKLRADIDDLANAQQKLRVAEHDHRNTIEDANERVLLWSVFEIIALFGMGIFQIFFLKRFLEKRTSV